ncbi:MAG: hypothetical protein IKO55_12450 [Kiritimatiellae bacterium]|nr:hypothetical protein [Kiritimatiellia bacterium]
MNLKSFIASLIRHKTKPVEEPREKFASRVSAEKVLAAVQRVLGRPLLASERAAFDDGWRPQGLLSADDGYAFRVASGLYLGRAATVRVFALASDGYGRDDDMPLSLVETALVTLESAGVNSPVEFVD